MICKQRESLSLENKFHFSFVFICGLALPDDGTGCEIYLTISYEYIRICDCAIYDLRLGIFRFVSLICVSGTILLYFSGIKFIIAHTARVGITAMASLRIRL